MPPDQIRAHPVTMTDITTFLLLIRTSSDIDDDRLSTISLLILFQQLRLLASHPSGM
jgi:hypothetical protein